MENKTVSMAFEEGLFKNLFLEFISYKRGCGLKYKDSMLYTLRYMNRQLNRYHVKEAVLTKRMVEEVCSKRPHEAYSTQSKRVGMLRQFAGFLNNRGIEAYIYPEMSRHNESSSFVPYIFSHSEIASIFDVTDHLPVISRYPTYTFIYPVLMRLLYSCGLRISEALTLQCQDVDLAQGILFIEKSKKGNSRFVPMSHSMAETCRDYAKRMSFRVHSNGYFFPSPDGGKYNRHSAKSTIQNIYAKAGISKLPNGRYPRVHDMRHTQAVHALEKMQAEGMDLYYSLPILCSYLGHKDIRSTEKYLRLPYFKHDEVALSSDQLVQGMIPEVHWDEE